MGLPFFGVNEEIVLGAQSEIYLHFWVPEFSCVDGAYGWDVSSRVVLISVGLEAKLEHWFASSVRESFWNVLGVFLVAYCPSAIVETCIFSYVL